MLHRILRVIGIISLVNINLLGCGVDDSYIDNSIQNAKEDSLGSPNKNSLNALRQAFKEAAQNRYIDPPDNLTKEKDPYREIDEYEAEDIINQLKQDGITPSELLQYRYSTECDEISCPYKVLNSARKRFRAFRSSEEMRECKIPGIDLPDPPLSTRANEEVKYQPMEPRLFVEGRSSWDVLPGTILDNSFFLASLAAIGRGGEWSRTSWDIDEAIKWNDDGTFTVIFYEPDGTPITIIVDSDIPVGKGEKLVYAHSRNSGELWPGLFEKAYALWKGGYDALANEGSASDVLFAITGRPVETVAPANTDEFFNKIKQAGENNVPMIATSKVDSNAYAEGKPSQRSYMLDMAAKRSDKQYIILHPGPFSSDPLNRKEYLNASGKILLPLNTFVELFSEVAIAQ